MHSIWVELMAGSLSLAFDECEGEHLHDTLNALPSRHQVSLRNWAWGPYRSADERTARTFISHLDGNLNETVHTAALNLALPYKRTRFARFVRDVGSRRSQC